MASASLARTARRFASATTPPGAFSRERLAAWRHALHRQPELGFDLFKTSQFVADTLASFGGDMDITRGLGGTGVVASLRGGGGASGRGIALRADMDALPISEEAAVPYRSEVDGVAHLCGHDGHTAMLLGAAEHLVSVADTLDGTVHFVFQPAEEAGGGGEVVVRAGKG